MDRENWILWRAYAPAAAAFVLAMCLLIPLAGLRDNPFTAGLFNIVRWIPLAAAGGATVLAGVASYRLRRWQRGRGPSCVFCAGPFGHEREGRADRGGAFRRCYAPEGL